LQAFGLAGSRYQAMELLAGRMVPDLKWKACILWRGGIRCIAAMVALVMAANGFLLKQSVNNTEKGSSMD